MQPAEKLALSTHFTELTDPRVTGRTAHPLMSIVIIAICSVIIGADTWEDIAEFGEARAEWFSTFLELPNGIPSHDTFNRVFAALNPTEFRTAFSNWVKALVEELPAQVIAIDGKTSRHSYDHLKGTSAIHMVSAWAAENRLILGQIKVNEKSNEITAIPQLLHQLALNGCIVTIDAMGCQRTIAQQIIDQEGNYVLALKDNQGTLLADVNYTFSQAQGEKFVGITHDSTTTIDKDHGRIENRKHTVISDVEMMKWIQDQHHWPGLSAIGMVEAQRHIGSKHTTETRYYLLSEPLSAQAFGATVRSHWGIENQLHWVLDVEFREDQSRIRQGYAAENFAVLRHIALNALQQQPVKRLSIRTRRLKAGWDNAYMLKVLSAI